MQVQVNVLALDAHNATDFELFADNCCHGIELVLNGLVTHGGCEERLKIGCARSNGCCENLVCEVNELLVLCNEVGFGVDLDENANAIGNLSDQKAGGCLTIFALGERLQTLQANDFESLFSIAISLGQSLLHVHHACAGLLTQSLDVSSGEIRH